MKNKTLKQIMEEFESRFWNQLKPEVGAELRAFITQSIKEALEAVAVSKYSIEDEHPDKPNWVKNGWEGCRRVYRDRVKKFLGEK